VLGSRRADANFWPFPVALRRRMEAVDEAVGQPWLGILIPSQSVGSNAFCVWHGRKSDNPTLESGIKKIFKKSIFATKGDRFGAYSTVVFAKSPEDEQP